MIEIILHIISNYSKGEDMEDLNKRLVEVEYILKKLDDEYIKKIPLEIWNYIDENKDKN